MLFNLIVPTLNRRDDVVRLLFSIVVQSCRDLEGIIVDQNSNGMLDAACREFAARLSLLHLKVERLGAARSRNHRLQFAKGGTFNFPDDSCEFPPELLAQVAERFREAAGLDALFVERERTYNNGTGFGRLSVKHTPLYQHPDSALRFVKFRVPSTVAALLYLCLLDSMCWGYYLMVVYGGLVGVFRSWSKLRRKPLPGVRSPIRRRTVSPLLAASQIATTTCSI